MRVDTRLSAAGARDALIGQFAAEFNGAGEKVVDSGAACALFSADGRSPEEGHPVIHR